MSKRSKQQAIAALSAFVLASLLGACAGNSADWTAPGWYLEQPRLAVATGPQLFGGPFSYEKCELERLKAIAAERMLCINEKVKPPLSGPY
jgi:hypothetical protein